MTHPEGYEDWLVLQLGGIFLPHLFALMTEQRDGLKQQALGRGDTEYEKGQVAALDWAIDLQDDAKKTEINISGSQ